MKLYVDNIMITVIRKRDNRIKLSFYLSLFLIFDTWLVTFIDLYSLIFPVGPILEVGLSRRHLGLGWFGPPTTHLTTHKQHIWAFNWWINKSLCFSYCIILKLESTERSFKSWNDILSHKFFSPTCDVTPSYRILRYIFFLWHFVATYGRVYAYCIYF